VVEMLLCRGASGQLGSGLQFTETLCMLIFNTTPIDAVAFLLTYLPASSRIFSYASREPRPSYTNMAVNASLVSPTADAKVAHMIQHFDTNGLLSSVFAGFSAWTLVLTLVVTAVVYDQCTTNRPDRCAWHC
jgi:hypothetical protein